MLVGITIDKYKGINPSVFVKITRLIGLDFVEITKNVFDDLPGVLSEIGHIKTGFHLPNFNDFGFDLSCDDHQEEIDQLIQLINTHHKKLNVQYCLSHPPECTPASPDRKTTLFANLIKLEPPIIVENIPELNPAQFNNFYAMAKSALGDKLIGQCYDAPHHFVRGEDPVSILKDFDGVIKSVHLSDCRKEKDAHLPFGMGGILPIQDILKTLKQQNYDGVINLEILPRSLSEIGAVIDSYLKVLKIFNKTKYYRTKTRLIFYLPMLRRILNN